MLVQNRRSTSPLSTLSPPLSTLSPPLRRPPSARTDDAIEKVNKKPRGRA